MIKLPKKDSYTIGIMTGSFHTDYSDRIANAISEALMQEDADVRIILMQGLDAKRYLSFNASVDESFDKHYYSLFEYGKFVKPDLLIASFGTISAVPSPMSAEEFFAPFKGIPSIVLEDDSPINNNIYIVVDNYQGMYDCVEHLINHHKLQKILFVSGPANVPDAVQRSRAYYDAMKNNGLEVDGGMVAAGNFSDAVDPIIEELLDRNPDAEAICCANDETAESVYRVLAARGLMPGRDIAVTGFDDISGAKYMNPPLTTVRQSFRLVADQVGEIVRKLIKGESASSVTIPADLIIRGSCGCKYSRVADEEEDMEQATEARNKIKNLQTRSIVSSLMLRDLLSRGISSAEFFDRLGHVLSNVGTETAYVCLLDRPISTDNASGYFLPDSLQVNLALRDGRLDVKGFDDAVFLNEEAMSKILARRNTSNLPMSIFPLFYQDEHYGALFVDINRIDMHFYYTLSLEIGTGLRFLRMELENQKANRELREQNRFLDYSATHDSMTDCYNRNEALKRALAYIMERAEDEETDREYVIAMADLDYLKQINDLYGHSEGDLSIRESASILKSALPSSGIIGRAGGDEYICFFEIERSYDSERFIRKVKRECHRYNESSGKPYYLDISIGCHTFKASSPDEFEEALTKADERLYVSKEFRKDSVSKDTESDEGRAEDALNRYLAQTEEIRSLSAPQIADIKSADSYRETLINNYIHIGELAKDNIDVLNTYLYPMLESGRDLVLPEIKIMRSFSQALSDAYLVNNLDNPLVYQQAVRLLREADRTQDDSMRIMALDEVVSASYLMMNMTLRLMPVSDLCMRYYKQGFRAAERLLIYMGKDKFETLSEDDKEMVLINARYLRVISEIDGDKGDPVQNSLLLNRMKASLKYAADPFYRDHLPSYDWDTHIFRTYEYICSLTDYNNDKEYDAEDLKYINECTKRMKEMYDSDDGKFRGLHVTKAIDIYLCRNPYLAGEISLEEYKRRLTEIINKDYRSDLTQDVPLVMLQAPLEYMLILDRDNLSDEETETLCKFYNDIVTYMHQTPKKGMMTFLVSILSLILRNFIEIPGRVTIESICLGLIAALHPTTYVHTLTVADLTKALTRHLIDLNPELFTDMPGMKDADDVRSKSNEIIDFAYHSALCHDVGKPAILEAIMTYGRNLLDSEFECIKEHPTIGAYILSLSSEASDYQDVALGHHKWYDNQGGYPASFDLDASPYKTIVSIVRCADCLDAATDEVGRSYKQGKSLEDVVEEFRSGSGTLYAPYVVDLFEDKNLCSEIKKIIETGRSANYEKAFSTLKSHAPEE